MDIKILKRDPSLAIINNEDFISIWKSLANDSEEFTLIQEYDFVVSWYKAYQNKYDPIMVIAYDQDKKVIGILPLAISLDNGTISHAGAGQAEYNSWICKKEYEEDFLVQSLILLKKEFDLVKWDWGWMPANASTDWLSSEKLKKNGIFVNVGTFESPRYDLSDLTRITKIKKSKSLRSNMNRLKRSGDLRIERITDITAAKAVFDDLKKIYNFRNLAVYDNMPFEDDDSKEQWHLNHLLNSDNSVHFSVLWQGDELLACNFGFCSDTTVMMGLFAYNPVQGARSPGNIFLIMLTEFIAEEGYKYLDLTPGGDTYKERFCNTHITLKKPIFFFNKLTKYKNNSLIYLKNKVKEKYSYKDIVNFKGSVERKFKNVILKKPQVGLNNETELFVYTPNTNGINSLSVGFQKFEDLLLYKNNSVNKRTEVVFTALKNFERDDHLYTLVRDGELLMYTWVSTSKRKHFDDSVNAVLKTVGSNPLFYDTHSLGSVDDVDKDIYSDFLHNVMKNYDDNSDVYIVKPETARKNQILQLGFKSATLES